MGGIEVKDFADGWDRSQLRLFAEVWERWHLNDMNAGTPQQMALVREMDEDLNHKYPDLKGAPHAKAHAEGFDSYYTMVCNHLKTRGLIYDGSFEYGTAWLYEEVPAKVLGFLAGLPDSPVQPAWV